MAEVRPIPELQDAFKPAPLRGQSREDYRADLTDRIVGVLLDDSPSNSDKTSCRAAVEHWLSEEPIKSLLARRLSALTPSVGQ